MSRRGALKGAAELWEASFAITGDLSELTPAELRYVLRGLTDGQKAELATRWYGFENKGQREPPGDWRVWLIQAGRGFGKTRAGRSEEHTSELQSLMRISYAVFCLKKKNNRRNNYN